MKKVLVFGGTHGNEWTGIAVVNQYEDYFKKKFPKLELHFIHANPEAYKINKRFKEEDLNRAFSFLNEKRTSYEHLRAKEIKTLIDKEECFVIDLHTTTSHMGKTLIVTHYNPLNLKISEMVSVKQADTKIIGSPDPDKKYLVSQSDFGLMIEVGPVANGIVEPVALKQTLELLDGILEALTELPKELKGEVSLFEETEDVYYPQNSKGEISAFIHSDFQGKDFIPVSGKFNDFESYSGEFHSRSLNEIHYPIFINEAAYYPAKLAYSLCKKKILTF